METRFKTKKDDTTSLGKCRLALSRSDIVRCIERLSNSGHKSSFHTVALRVQTRAAKNKEHSKQYTKKRAYYYFTTVAASKQTKRYRRYG